MKTQKYILIALAFVLSLTSMDCIGKRYEKKETSEYKIGINGKNRISIENVNGIIEITKSDSTEGVYVKADMIAKVKKKELDKPFSELSIEIDTSGDVIKIIGDYHKEKHFFNFQVNENPKIDFKIRVPESFKVDVDNVNGKIDARNIKGDMKITLVNGDIRMDQTPGNNIIDITNGDIRQILDSTKGFSIDVVNGDVYVDISKNYQGEISADIVHGKIDFNNLDVIVRSDEKKSFRGYIGNRNTTIKCDVVNGKIVFNGR
ncbi:MAG: hypothetical protein EHM58_07805 [Ignavibacteriae bacterium]|nr:MAG: hypothetical protein EHM58_07805 [Ignavibacteriota bacterium]